jgi:hypothetical protein
VVSRAIAELSPHPGTSPIALTRSRASCGRVEKRIWDDS